MTDYRIEAATKEEWAARCFAVEAQRDAQADRIDALEKALRERDMAALAEEAVAAGVSRSSFAQEAEYEHDRAALGEGE